MATIISVPNETTSSSSRMSKEGKKITYSMKVIQQPERARACGSGAKSSADRRPVDPPPIVELRVFEGEGNNLNEITFSYNANFFLFATLENARTIAQGRVAPAPTSFPVLTGTPVAGMAYLDRPSPAGYFIFPDLSVRHEGKYRLSFALYEELKEQKDMDPEDAARVDMHNRLNMEAQHVSHRLEVKSSPFTVFSAKKFPGLTESTALSRMVAEQGCRVRIRRDVRMRRRDTKSTKEWDEYEEEAAYERAQRTATPDAYGLQTAGTPQAIMDPTDRPRSVSNASNTSYVAAPPRRPSVHEMAQGYQQNYPPHMASQPQQNSYSQMPYGSSQSHQYSNTYPPPPQPQAMMPPPQAPYQPPHHGGYQSQPSMSMPQYHNAYMSNQTYQQPQYDQPTHIRPESQDYANAPADYRRPSIPQPQTPQYASTSSMMAPGPYCTLDNYSRSNSIAQPPPPLQPPRPSISTASSTTSGSTHMTNGHSLAPLKTLQPPMQSDKIEPSSPSYPMPTPMSASSESLHSNYIDASRAAPSKYSQPTPSTSKRSYASSFDTKHLDQPLRQGARPPATRIAEDYGLDEEDQEFLDERAMSYRRADGTHRSRRVPLPGQ